MRGARAGIGGGRRVTSAVGVRRLLLSGEEVEEEVEEELAVPWFKGLRLLRSRLFLSCSADRLLPMLFAPDEGDDEEGEVEDEDWDEGSGPSHTSLIRLFRMSKLRAGPLLRTGPSLPPPFSTSAGQRGTLRAGGVLIWQWSIIPGGTRGLRMMGGLMGAWRVRATCWLLTYLALSASRRSTALSLRAPGSACRRKYSGPLLSILKGMAEVKGTPARRPSEGRRVSTGILEERSLRCCSHFSPFLPPSPLLLFYPSSFPPSVKGYLWDGVGRGQIPHRARAGPPLLAQQWPKKGVRAVDRGHGAADGSSLSTNAWKISRAKTPATRQPL